jgi:biopolymer transport protein ExbB/TolQ
MKGIAIAGLAVGIVGLVIGAGGLTVAIVALVRTNRLAKEVARMSSALERPLERIGAECPDVPQEQAQGLLLQFSNSRT